MRMSLNKAEPGRSAERQADEMGARNSDGVHERDHIGDQCVECIAAGRHFGLPMAALVVAQNAEVPLKFGELRFPHRKIGREGIRKHEPRRILGAIDCIIEVDAIGLDSHVPPFRLSLSR